VNSAIFVVIAKEKCAVSARLTEGS